MFVSQIQLTWGKYGATKMAHGIFYVCHKAVVNEQIKCIKQMFDIMVNESEKLADSPFYQLLKF